MTKEKAKTVKHLRCTKRYSWRMISLSIEGIENQELGIHICENAAKVLGEKHNEEPWN